MKSVTVYTHITYVMMRTIWIALFALLLAPAQAQIQMKYWYFNGEGVDFTGTSPVVFSTQASVSGADGAANGFSVNSQNPYFHIIDETLFDRNGNSIGYIQSHSGLGPEMLVLPVPGSCTRFYLVYLAYGTVSLFYEGVLYYSELDITLNNGLGGFVTGKHNVHIATIPNDGIGSFAVGKESSNGTRNLYFAANKAYGGDVLKCVIDANGISYHSTLYSVNYPGTPGRMATAEVELSHDGTMLAFALLAGPSGEDVVLLHLDANGDLNTNLGNNGVTIYDMPGSSSQSFTGIEFSPDNGRLFVGASGVGIYWIDLSSTTITFISNSDDLGDSQIELAHDGFMYAAESASKLVAIDWDRPTPIIAPHSITFSGSPVIANTFTSWFNNNPSIYTLPEQIDGQNYDDFFITPYDKLAYTATASATWTSGSNPLNNSSGNVVYIRDELRIPAGKVVTITDMELYFAPGARVVVEQGIGPSGPGGKLVLDNTLFTADDRCYEPDF